MAPQIVTRFWEEVKDFMSPPTSSPGYDILEFLAQDQHALNQGLLLGISFEAIEKGHAAIAEKHHELLEEATRLVERELKLSENSQKLHANAVQFGLVAAGIVASLGGWLNLYWVWMPLVAFILSIATAWWFLCQEPPDWIDMLKSWGQNMPKKVGEMEIPDHFRKEMYAHLYERIFYSVVRDYRRWLHKRLAVPASLFITGLLLLLVCVAISN